MSLKLKNKVVGNLQSDKIITRANKINNIAAFDL